MKDLKELYEILLNYYSKSSKNYICNTIDNIWFARLITLEEKQALQAHFNTQRPTSTLHPEFFKHKLFTNPERVGEAWFNLCSKPIAGKRVRKEFIKKKFQPYNPIALVG